MLGTRAIAGAGTRLGRCLAIATAVCACAPAAASAQDEFQRVSPLPRTYQDRVDFLEMTGSAAGNVTASARAVDYGSGTSGCNASDFAGFPAGSVALMDRGGCLDGIKSAQAAAAGAVAVVIANDQPGLFEGSVLVPPGNSPSSIPVISLTREAGLELVQLQSSGLIVRVATNGDGPTQPPCQGTTPTLPATDEADTIDGTSERDVIQARGGADIVRAFGGSDLVCLSGGADQADGGAGSDSIYGGPGEDDLSGGANGDLIHGLDDGDMIAGGTGHDQLFGDTGNDTIDGEAGNDDLRGGLGIDECNGGTGADTYTNCETITDPDQPELNTAP